MKRYIFLITIFTAIQVLGYATNYSHISKVFEYCPAPGQFVNELPEYDDGDNKETMRSKAETALIDGDLITLGGYGGYILLGFDHSIANVEGECDFKILGNAIYSNQGVAQDGKQGGSAEPGIVMVSYDANKNGLPDDEWYEIAGSEYNNALTKKNYTITYYKPDENKTPVSAGGIISDAEYIRYTDSDGVDTYLPKNTFHKQSYYPLWEENNTISYTGTLLPQNGVNESVNGTQNYVLYCYDYGYADNHPNTSDKSNINIDWAVDADGNKAPLKAIDFVKIYTGVNQFNGWLGECSTELLGINDLHPEISSVDIIEENSISIFPNPCTSYLNISSSKEDTCLIFNTMGQVVSTNKINIGNNNISMEFLPNGIYYLRFNNKTYSIIKHN